MRNEEDRHQQDDVKTYEELMKSNAPLQDYLKVASLANLALVKPSPGGWKGRGDPLEVAIQVFISRFNYNCERLKMEDSWS